MRLKKYLLILSTIFASKLCLAIDYLPGDIAPRGAPDGVINVADVLVLNRIILDPTIVPTELEKLVADMAPVGAPDDIINVADVLVLNRIMSGDITLPVISILPPVITIDSPINGAILTSSEVNVTGSVDKSSIIEINGIEIPIDLNFQFSTVVNLREGDNHLIIQATDIYGHQTAESVLVTSNRYISLPPNPVKIQITNNSDQTTVQGSAGAVEPGAEVIVRVNGISVYSTQADETGAFSILVTASSSDRIEIFQRDSSSVVSDSLVYVVGSGIQILEPAYSDTTEQYINVVALHDELLIDSGVMINDQHPCSYGTYSILNNHLLSDGDNNINVDLSHRDGTNATATTSVQKNINSDVYYFGADSYCSIGSSSVSFIADASNVFSDLHIDYDDDGRIDYKSSEASDGPTHIFSELGVHRVNAWFILSDGSQIKRSLYIVINSKEQLNGALSQIWVSFRDSLLQANVDSAATYVSPDSLGLYQSTFNVLSPHMASVFSNMTLPKIVTSDENAVSTILVRSRENTNKIFFINYHCCPVNFHSSTI